MAARDLLGRLGDKASESLRGERSGAPDAVPLGGTRTEAMQRLQVGLTGLCTMILVISIASIIGGQADIAEQAAVPDAAPTTEPTAAPPQRDPLADAGVVPDIPPQPEADETRVPAKPGGAGPDRPLRDRPLRDRPLTVPDTPSTDPQKTGRTQR